MALSAHQLLRLLDLPEQLVVISQHVQAPAADVAVARGGLDVLEEVAQHRLLGAHLLAAARWQQVGQAGSGRKCSGHAGALWQCKARCMAVLVCGLATESCLLHVVHKHACSIIRTCK